jgi:hypothetical protein
VSHRFDTHSARTPVSTPSFSMSPGIRPQWVLGAAALLALAVFGAACTCAEDDPSATPPARIAPSSAAPGQPSAEPELPAPGSALFWSSAAGFNALVNGVPRPLALQQLAREARFELVFAEEMDARDTIVLRAVGVPLEEVLAGLLEGVPHSLGYGRDPDDGRRVVTRVTVGVAANAKAPAVGRRAAAPPEQRLQGSDSDATELERQLADPDPEVRAEAASWIDTDAEGLARLGEILANDPSPAVRAAAAETLGDEESAVAVNLLLHALRDPEPQVVIEALDALEYIGDETLIPELRFLREHPSPEVRERALEAIDWLE